MDEIHMLQKERKRERKKETRIKLLIKILKRKNSRSD